MILVVTVASTCLCRRVLLKREKGYTAFVSRCQVCFGGVGGLKGVWGMLMLTELGHMFDATELMVLRRC